MNLNNKNENLISVIMPTYNSSKYVLDAIESVINQSYREWELIIVDDCSSDNTRYILSKLAISNKKIKVYWQEKNKGAAQSRNLAIDKSKGRYIAFLDSDDLWAPSKLEKQLAFMRKHNASFSFTKYNTVDQNSLILNSYSKFMRLLSYKRLLFENIIGTSTVMYDSLFFGKEYMPNLNKRQDYGLWLKLLKKTPFAYGLDEVLSSYRITPSSLSANKLSLIRYNWELFYKQEKLSFLASSFYLTANVLFRIKKGFKLILSQHIKKVLG